MDFTSLGGGGGGGGSGAGATLASSATSGVNFGVTDQAPATNQTLVLAIGAAALVLVVAILSFNRN